MFDEYYVRLPYEKLGKETEVFLKKGIRPEIFINGKILRQLTVADIRNGKNMVAAFPSHTIHAPFMDISPGAHDDDVRGLSFAKMEKVMEIARQWNSRLVVMHFNYDPIYYRHHFPEWVKRAADFFRRLLKARQKTMIALENVADPTPFVALHLLESISDPRAIHCLDLGHRNVFGELSFEDWLLYLAPQNHIHFHFHDNDGGEDTHLPLGKGTIDWHRVKSILTNLRTDFSIGLEPHSHDDLLETLRFYESFFL